MAYVDNHFSKEGTELSVDIRGRREVARVVATPFYRRAR
jgi:glycine cleavage system aminomethyltransferase T